MPIGPQNPGIIVASAPVYLHGARCRRTVDAGNDEDLLKAEG
jgi:hypothetical protein